MIIAKKKRAAKHPFRLEQGFESNQKTGQKGKDAEMEGL